MTGLDNGRICVTLHGSLIRPTYKVFGDEGDLAMSRDLEHLIEQARRVRMSPQEKEEQRRSFAYGNTKIENPRITREIIDQEAEKLARNNGQR
jgi:hypothetical protein